LHQTSVSTVIKTFNIDDSVACKGSC